MIPTHFGMVLESDEAVAYRLLETNAPALHDRCSGLRGQAGCSSRSTATTTRSACCASRRERSRHRRAARAGARESDEASFFDRVRQVLAHARKRRAPRAVSRALAPDVLAHRRVTRAPGVNAALEAVTPNARTSRIVALGRGCRGGRRARPGGVGAGVPPDPVEFTHRAAPERTSAAPEVYGLSDIRRRIDKPFLASARAISVLRMLCR